MGFNKNRLYVALYPSGISNNEERRYHWGFLIGPKNESGDRVPGTRCHVKNRPVNQWIYEEVPESDVRSTDNLLVRILVAKIQNEERVIEIIRSTPVVQGDPNWRCRTWLADALSRIAQGGKAVGTANLDWATVEKAGREYAVRKTAEGRYARGKNMELPMPTWDLLEGKEVVP